MENLVLTGLRGLGKTVLLEKFKPTAVGEGWLWAGTDLSESTSISEENLATRLLTDLAVVTSSITLQTAVKPSLGFMPAHADHKYSLSYERLIDMYQRSPGLVADKIKAVLETVWPYVEQVGKRGIVFAYDEAQNLSDHAAKDQYPLSLLLDCFQSLQRKGIRFMLALSGLPTLFPKLVQARTYAERMFHVVFLDPLNLSEMTDAVRKPLADSQSPFGLNDASIQVIWQTTKGYPYFIQYVCREAFDVWIQADERGLDPQPIPVSAITAKLDSDFFAGRWAKATDRQRELLNIVSRLENCDSEFSVIEVVEHPLNRLLTKPFSSSHINQMLASLSAAGLVYKNRHGKYSFAVPLLADFIRRHTSDSGAIANLFA